jgi:small subunit ribosomal protein S16
MVIIRLARSGAKKNPYYFITVADERRPRDGSFIERLGFFNPSARGQEERLRVDLDKISEWVSKGAQLSERVQTLVKEAKLSPEDLQAKLDAKKAKSDAKKAAVEARLAKEAEEKAAEKAAEEAAAEKAAEEVVAEEAAAEKAAEEVVAEEAPVAEEVVAEEVVAEEAPVAEEVVAEEAPVAEEESEIKDSSDDESK